MPFLPPNQQRLSTEGTGGKPITISAKSFEAENWSSFQKQKSENLENVRPNTLRFVPWISESRHSWSPKYTLGSMCGSPLSLCYDLFQGPPESTRPAPNGTVAMLESNLGTGIVLQVLSWSLLCCPLTTFCWPFTKPVGIPCTRQNNNNNDDRLTAFDPGQPG